MPLSTLLLESQLVFLALCPTFSTIGIQEQRGEKYMQRGHKTAVMETSTSADNQPEPMEDLDENIPNARSNLLFIKEEEGDRDRANVSERECNTNHCGLTFAGTHLKQSALIKPYLQEMDELLKNCEEMTGIPFRPHCSASHTEEVTLLNDEERCIPPYLDTHMEGAGAEDQFTQKRSITNQYGVTREASRQTEMPLTSVGNKLSDNMMEYEGQLMGILAMLENCMEEAGMDFEPQDWVTDSSQEYVHISKNQHPYRGTAVVPIQEERTGKLETQTMQSHSWADKQQQGYRVFKNSQNRMAVSSGTSGSQQSPLHGCENFSKEGQERTGNFSTDIGGHDLQIRSSELMRKDDRVYCEGTNRGQTFNEGLETQGDVTGIEIDDIEVSDEKRQELKMDTTTRDLEAVGSQMENCIEEVQQLKKRRRELLEEVLQLRGQRDREATSKQEEETEEQIDRKVAELMDRLRMEKVGKGEERKKEVLILREERAEEERRTWKVNLERQGLQDELRKLKRRLFGIVRDCAHSQAALNNQRREMELLQREEEKLNSLVLQLTEEGCQLKATQQQKLSVIRGALQTQSPSQTLNTQEELTECRRHSCGDIQQYLQGGLRALEERFEPILLALLKRGETTADAVIKAKEQSQELRAKLGPLKEETQKLMLQRACLEEKLKLIHMQRQEDVGQYKETICFLEESSKGLKTELQIQRKKTNAIEELKNSLSKQLLLYKAVIGSHV